MKPETLKLLISAYPSAKITEDTISTYRELLSDLDPDKLHEAAREYIRNDNSPWFPSIGKLRELAERVEARGAELNYWYSMSLYRSYMLGRISRRDFLSDWHVRSFRKNKNENDEVMWVKAQEMTAKDLGVTHGP